MIVSVYAIRHQGAGVLVDHIYTAPPGPEELKRVKAIEDARRGSAGWVRVVQLPIELHGALADMAHLFSPAPEPPLLSVHSQTCVPRIVVRATGAVTPPR
jgi:hypothetical protein